MARPKKDIVQHRFAATRLTDIQHDEFKRQCVELGTTPSRLLREFISGVSAGEYAVTATEGDGIRIEQKSWLRLQPSLFDEVRT